MTLFDVNRYGKWMDWSSDWLTPATLRVLVEGTEYARQNGHYNLGTATVLRGLIETAEVQELLLYCGQDLSKWVGQVPVPDVHKRVTTLNINSHLISAFSRAAEWVMSRGRSRMPPEALFLAFAYDQSSAAGGFIRQNIKLTNETIGLLLDRLPPDLPRVVIRVVD